MMKQHERILVVRTDRIGDVVLATPLIRELRQTFPKAFIAAMVQPYTKDVLVNNPHLDEIILDEVEQYSISSGFWKQVKKLKSYKFDTALLLLPTERLAWMLFFADIRTRISVGLKPYEALTFMKTVSRHKYNPLRHEADYCMDLGRRIGVTSSNLRTEIFLTDFEKEIARDKMRRLGVNYAMVAVGIHPSNGHSAPNWKVERYVELAEQLLEFENVQIITTGSSKDIHLTDYFEEINSGRIINLIGKTSLRELIAVISQYDVLISSSTGPMHIAAALGVPTISMFCPLTACSPRLWGPLGNASKIIFPREDYCSFRCLGDPHICDFEDGISVKQVVEALKYFLYQRQEHQVEEYKRMFNTTHNRSIGV